MGQADSPLLTDEPGLVLDGRLAREQRDPLRTNFAEWTRALIEVAPQHDLSALAIHFDQMSLNQWCEAGDRATVIDSVDDGFGIWCAARRLHQGRFLWTALTTDRGVALTRLQFDALIVGLPWARIEEMQRIAYV